MNKDANILSVDKNYILASEYFFDITNRAFRYGDGFFETMHANGSQVQFIEDHWERMLQAANILQIHLPEYLNLEFLKRQISGLLTRLKLFQAARVKLMVIRDSEGLFIPASNNCQIIIEASYLGKGPYELNDKSLIIGIFDEFQKPKIPYLTIKSLNALPYILAGIYARDLQLGDALLIDNKGFLVEATSSNLFLVKEKKMITPALDTGCVNGIMRKQVIKAASTLGYRIDDQALLTKEDLLEVDEVFLTNAVVGIRSVTAFEKRRYFKKNASKLLAELNRMAFSSSRD